MDSARQDILGRIRNSTRDANKGAYEAIHRNYAELGSLSHEEKLLLLEDRLRDYGCAVWQCSQELLSPTIKRVLQERGKQAVFTSADILPEWLPGSGITFHRDGPNVSYRELDQSEGVLTSCALAIAETGTIVLQHSKLTARRALTLLPDYHLCLIFESQLVASVPAGLERMKGFSPHPVTTVSGPSATADIEMIRVQGVHGPRTLDVIVVCSPVQ